MASTNALSVFSCCVPDFPGLVYSRPATNILGGITAWAAAMPVPIGSKTTRASTAPAILLIVDLLGHTDSTDFSFLPQKLANCTPLSNFRNLVRRFQRCTRRSEPSVPARRNRLIASLVCNVLSTRPLQHGGSSRRALEIAPQRIPPFRHADVIGVQAIGRQNGVSGPSRRTREFGCGHGFDCGRQAGRAHDFNSELVPRAVAGIGDVHNPAGGGAAQLGESGCEIARESWAATLIVYYGNLRHHGNFRTSRRQLQNRGRKALASVPEQPRSPRDADLGQYLEKPFLGPGFTLAINAGRISSIVGLVRRSLAAIKNVVRAQEHQ